MNQKLKEFVIYYLMQHHDCVSGQCCDDMPDAITDMFTEEEWKEMYKEFEDFNSGGKDYDPNTTFYPVKNCEGSFIYYVGAKLAKEWGISTNVLEKLDEQR